MKQNYKQLHEELVLTQEALSTVSRDYQKLLEKYDNLEEEFMHTTNKYYSDLFRSSNAKIEANKKLEELNKSYEELKTDFEELSDNYSTLQVKYGDLLKENKSLEKSFQGICDNYYTLNKKYKELCEEYSFSEILRHILVRYITNN